MITTVTLLLGLLSGSQAADEASKKELANLEGTWVVELLEYNGQNVTERYKMSFVFKGQTVTVEGNKAVQKEYARLGLKLDPTTTPKCVDIGVVGGVQKDAQLEGIYELKDDELKLCVKVIGKDRPTKFESPSGESIALLKLKRQK
jgi:uncharacterized protein (TIGR03067 family)